MVPLMEDFATLLLGARARAGLTQAQLAVAAGLTPSYLSFIENKKKPPPSDDVCERLAKVLNIPAKRLIEVAHLERAPTTVKRKLRSLNTSLKRERRSRRRILESLLSPFLFRGPPGYVESAVESLAIPPRRRRRIREVLAAVGRRNIDREGEISALVDELPERERSALLEVLPELLGRTGERKMRAADPPAEPRLLYAPPEADDPAAKGPYLLEATADMEGGAGGGVRAGDLLLVDPALPARPGDLVVLRAEAGPQLRQVEPGEGPYQGQAGTVIEVRRRLRR